MDGPSFKEIGAFVLQHKNWPNQKALKISAENALKGDENALDVLRWFSVKGPNNSLGFEDPLTAKGKQVLAERILLNPNDLASHQNFAIKLIREAWVESDFKGTYSATFYGKYKDILRKDDHEARIRRLLMDGQATEATKLLPLADAKNQKLFEARIKIIKKTKDAQSAVAALPRDLQGDEGLLYERIKWRDDRGDEEGVIQLLKYLPEKPEFASDWNSIRRIYIRELLQRGNYKLAYYISKTHGFTDNAERVTEFEWFAGWISHRYLKNEAQAFAHFQNIFQIAQTPVTLGRAAYWMGKSLEAMGKSEDANKWYKVASKYQTSFYGQLAMEKIGAEMSIPKLPAPTATDYKAFRANELVRCAAALSQLDMIGLGRKFAKAAVNSAKTIGEQIYVTRMGRNIGEPAYSIEAAKELSKNDGPIVIESLFPTISPLKDIHGRSIDEPAPEMIHAIIRQESMFDRGAKSSAGAMGLMQLMPATAKSVAVKNGVKGYNPNKLISDPKLNLMLGSAYLADRIDNYDGSYPMAFAAYNGGSGNVSKWVGIFGDPRNCKNADCYIDWIESIPFSETNNYVMRVLENAMIYRYVLSGGRDSKVVTSQFVMNRE
jgi:soluble lytic murein transglycosylase